MEHNIQKLEQRIARLEKAVFGENKSRQEKPTSNAFAGPSGGVRLLIQRNFFTSKRTLADVKSSLEKNNYHYVTQVVDTALRRLAKKNGPLVIIKDHGKNSYANRK